MDDESEESEGDVVMNEDPPSSSRLYISGISGAAKRGARTRPTTKKAKKCKNFNRCEGKGNTRMGYDKHTSSKYCPTNHKTSNQISEDEESMEADRSRGEKRRGTIDKDNRPNIDKIRKGVYS
jgi:hypothetical protein